MGVLRERSRKLLLPLAFGLAAYGPFLRWREMEHGMRKNIKGQFLPPEHVPFSHVLSLYFKDPGLLTWAHLWFLIYLWVFTLLYAPVWVALSPLLVRHASDRYTRLRVLLLLSLCAVTASEVCLRERWPGYQNLIDDWANFASYSVFVLLGLLIGAVPQLKEDLRQHSAYLLVLGLACSGWHASTWFEVSIFLSSGPSKSL